MTMPSDAPSPDALDAALDWLLSFYLPEFGTPEDRAAARAAVRKAKMEVGEAGAEWDIVLHNSVGIVEMRTPTGADRWEVYGLDGCKVTGVRVTRIEEAP